VTRKATIAIVLVWTLAVTCLRAARLPNNFSKEHWLIDYRFGFVKRGLVGSLVSVVARLLGRRPTEALINGLAIACFLGFCGVLGWVFARMLRRSRWSPAVVLAVLVFASSPFIVMSAHLIGYYDNIIIVLTIVSLALLLSGRPWTAGVVQAIAILVHENTLLVGFPVFCWTSWRLRTRCPSRARWRVAPLLLPVVTFVLLTVSQSLAPHRLERSLTGYLSTYPFVAGTIADVRVPHWITITFYDSYRLHQGRFEERMLSQTMISLVLPPVLAILGVLFEGGGVAAVSADALALVGICLLPQAMHVMAWDTSRIWTYAIVCAFLLLWVDVELGPGRRTTVQFVVLLSLVTLVVNAIAVTPLMDGLHDRLDVTLRLLLYAPTVGLAMVLARRDAVRRGEPSTSVPT
jgi:hypothetical protein